MCVCIVRNCHLIPFTLGILCTLPGFRNLCFYEFQRVALRVISLDRMNYFLTPNLFEIKTCQNRVKWAYLSGSAYSWVNRYTAYAFLGARNVHDSVHFIPVRERVSYVSQFTICLSGNALSSFSQSSTCKYHVESFHSMPALEGVSTFSRSTICLSGKAYYLLVSPQHTSLEARTAL